ncbi:MAG: nicotinate (nicotinamide) nucleotide adenylyltransferase [Clostridiales bacterium]|nr:nicotinate (nicotinamide) nucleotide adenylyltransferase [Clostridiales bacterium]
MKKEKDLATQTNREGHMQKIAIFGGTFNPPHMGHLRLVKSFEQQNGFDKILIIPTYTPPHKNSDQLASGFDRLQMCLLAFDAPNYEISDIEIKRGGKSYTSDTLKQLKEIYKDTSFHLIIGSDMFLTFHEWKNPQEIFDMCTICASVRDDDKTLEDLQKYAKEYFPNQADKLKIMLCDFEPLEVSSTQLRQMLANGQDVSHLVPKKVVEYINSRGLYNENNGAKY